MKLAPGYLFLRSSVLPLSGNWLAIAANTLSLGNPFIPSSEREEFNKTLTDTWENNGRQTPHIQWYVQQSCSKTKQGCDLTKVNKSGKMGSRPGSPFSLEDKPPRTSWMFGGFWRIYRLCTNKKLEVWTQYRLLLSFLGVYFSSFKKFLRQKKRFVKNPELRKKIWEITATTTVQGRFVVQVRVQKNVLEYEYEYSNSRVVK